MSIFTKKTLLIFLMVGIGAQSVPVRANSSWLPYIVGGIGLSALTVHIGNQIANALLLRRINREMFAGPETESRLHNWIPHDISQVPTYITTHTNNGVHSSSESEYHVSRINELRTNFNACNPTTEQINREKQELKDNAKLAYDIAGNMIPYYLSVDDVVGGHQNNATFQNVECRAWIYHGTAIENVIKKRCPQGLWGIIAKCMHWNFEAACILYWKLNKAKRWLDILKPDEARS